MEIDYSIGIFFILFIIIFGVHSHYNYRRSCKYMDRDKDAANNTKRILFKVEQHKIDREYKERYDIFRDPGLG